MTRKVKTIDLKGKAYVQVAERVRAIHEDHKGKFSIETSYVVTETGNIVFTAEVMIRNGEQVQTFTGHSFGKIAGLKGFEKLETIAVGRALAFAGYHADGEIASADEMQEHVAEIDAEALTDAIIKIQNALDTKTLNTIYRAMPIEIRQNKDVIEAGKIKKKELTTIV